jgi:hypothetical protein
MFGQTEIGIEFIDGGVGFDPGIVFPDSFAGI